MTTSDERREVAEALRGLRHRTYYSEEVMENIKDAISIADPVNTFREPEDVYELLADLIDPTTTVHVEDNLNESEGHGDAWEVCDACGGIMCVLTDVGNELVPGYCPCCGARVVSSNGD